MLEDVGRPADYRIIVAEDSPLIRKQVEDALTASGFTNLKICPDGKVAYDAIVKDRKDGVHQLCCSIFHFFTSIPILLFLRIPS